MPPFRYRARDGLGTAVEGAMEADSAAAVAERLQAEGLFPVRVIRGRARRGWLVRPRGAGRVPLEELVLLTRQWATLVRTGVPLLRGLETLRGQATSPHLARVLEEIAGGIRRGAPLAASLERHPQIFSRVYVETVRAGESSGRLEEVLARLGALLEHEHTVREELKAAMRYPALVVTAISLAFLVLVTFVLPRFAALFERFGVRLPLPTRALLWVNAALREYGPFLLLGAALVALAVRAYVRTPRGSYAWDRLKLALPGVGDAAHKASLSRFAHLFETLNSAGLPILDIMENIEATVGNGVVAREVRRLRERIREGGGVSGPMGESRLFPPLLVQLVATGEETGALDEMLREAHRHYDREVDYTLRRLTVLVEPVLTVGLGAVVLVMALAVFLPMWSLLEVFRR